MIGSVRLVLLRRVLGLLGIGPTPEHHRECVDLFASLHLARRRILVPGPVVAEVGYLLAREGGARVEAQF